MTFLLRHVTLTCLLGAAALIVSPGARAESPEAKRREFAELLARRAREDRAGEPRAHGGAGHHLAHVSHGVTSASASPDTFGIPPASPIAPPPGTGARETAFVEALFSQLLGRPATEAEVLYYSHLICYERKSPQYIAHLVYHMARTEGIDTGVRVTPAYNRAIAYAKARYSAQ